MKFLLETTYREIAYSSKLMNRMLNEYKIVVLRNYQSDDNPIEFFEDFTDNIGKVHYVQEDVKTAKQTGEKWIDVTFDPEITDKYRTASVAQPLHTDGSYCDFENNIQFLYCVKQARFGGATVFLDTKTLIQILDFENKSLLKSLMEIPIVHRKGDREKTKPILTKFNDDWKINWNYQPALNGNNNRELIDEFHNLLEKIVRAGLTTEVLLQENDVVFFHDELVLHGRNAYFAREKGERSLNKGTITWEV